MAVPFSLDHDCGARGCRGVAPVNLPRFAGRTLGVAALMLNARFVYGAWRLMQRSDATALADKFAPEKKYFRQSLTYLFLSFSALIADASLRAADIQLFG